MPLLLLIALAAACESGPGAPQATVRDSAGIAIVENPPAGEAPAVAVPAEPELQIGVLEGEEPYQLDGVRGAARLSDGRIAVLNGGSSEVRFFDAEGSFLRAVGGPGGGPGEFRSPFLVGRAEDDVLVVFDGANQRLTRIDPAGRVLSEHRADVTGIPFAQPVGLLDDGAVLLRGGISFRPGATPGVARNPVPFVLLDADGTRRDSLAELPGPEMYHQGPRATRMPFARETEAATGGDRIYIATNERWEIRVLRPDGSLERLIRVAGEPEAVSPEAHRRYIEERVEAAPAEQQAGQRRHYEEMPAPVSYPPHGRLLTDAAGRLWVQDFERSAEEPGTWSVFDAEGRRIARVTTPVRLRVHEIGDDYLLGSWRDELDVQRVRLHRLPPLGRDR